MGKFNDKLANALANGMSTVSFFYACVILDLIELPPVISQHSVITWCTYISQTVIQLLALPLLAYQNKMQQHNHEELMAHNKLLHKHVREIHQATVRDTIE